MAYKTKHKTVNASEDSFDILEQVRLDVEKGLKIPTSKSDAILIACSAYFDLKKIKVADKAKV